MYGNICLYMQIYMVEEFIIISEKMPSTVNAEMRSTLWKVLDFPGGGRYLMCCVCYPG